MCNAGMAPGSKQAGAIIVAEGGTCSVKLEKVVLHGCGIVTQHGASLTAIQCSSESAHGMAVRVQGGGSSAYATGCIFTGSRYRGIFVCDGGKATLADCICNGSKEQSGLCVRDAGSFADARGCTFADNQKDGVAVAGGGEAALADCTLRTCTGNSSITCQGNGSKVSANECSLDPNLVFEDDGGLVVCVDPIHIK